MNTIKITANATTKSIEAADLVKTLAFKQFDVLCLKRPVKLDGKELSVGADIDFGENAVIEMDGHTSQGRAELFVNEEYAVVKCGKPVDDSIALMSDPQTLGAAIDLSDISGSVGPFSYKVGVSLDTDNFLNSYFVVELKFMGVKLINVHLDASNPKVSFGGTVAGIGAKGTLGVDFNEGRVYVEAEVHYLIGHKTFSFDIYNWKNSKMQFVPAGAYNTVLCQTFGASSSGFITIVNKGAYVAKFDVAYTLNGKRVTQESGNFTAGTSKVIDIPAGSTDIVLHAYDAWFIKSWREIFSKHFDSPVTKKYELTGTTLDPDYREVPV
jgi:hypothetical protein